MDKKKELLKKLQALAERGVGGEKETAERKLRQLMEKYGIDEMEFAEDKLEEFEFKWQRRLILISHTSARYMAERSILICAMKHCSAFQECSSPHPFLNWMR